MSKETEQEKSTSVETKKLPPLDQVPDKPMPVLKRKEVRIDEDKSSDPPKAPWLETGEGDQEICGMHPAQVFSSLELVNRGAKEFDRQASLLNKRMEDIKVALKRINQISFLLNKHQMRLGAMNPGNPHDGVKRLQARTQERRMAAVTKTQEFLKGGTNLKDLQKALDPRSPLDQSLARPGAPNRRPAPGNLLKPIA